MLLDQVNERRENRGYQWRGFSFLPRNPFSRNRDREQHGHERHHTYNLSAVASGATWLVACTFIVAIVNTDWTPEPTLPNSPRIDIEPNIIHQKEFSPPAHDSGRSFIAANDSSIHYVGRWVPLTVARDASSVLNIIVPLYPASYLDLCHNSTTISIGLSAAGYADTSTARITLLYTTSLNHPNPIYQPILNVHPGTTPLAGAEDISGWKTTRVIFPLANEISNRDNVGILGFYVDPYTHVLPDSADAGLGGNEKSMTITCPSSRKLIEVITDSITGEFGMSPGAGGEVEASEKLAAVQPLYHWGWRVGEGLGADRRILGVDGMCLVPDCPGLQHSKRGLGDIYFQSGPAESKYADVPWDFAAERRPDVIVISLGNTDAVSLSIIQRIPGVDTTFATDAFINRFENSYVNFVRSIRNVAYPVHFNPMSGLEYDSEDETTLPTVEMQYVIPIYLLYPFTGGPLAASIQRIAARLAKGEEEGYRGVAETKIYTVDTTSWMNMKEGDLEQWSLIPIHNMSLNGSQLNAVDTFRLTPIGHEKAAVYLQPRLCRYLATNPRMECADLGEVDGGVTRGIPTHGTVRLRGTDPHRDRMLREGARVRENKLRGKFVW
ncbi:hypothetical protein L211DRAFT_563571 [Terfezia boudieri ATCC MYA-4762]|uniref:Uncharacterized protein n=1 Tax=Terfezia boudieri ATCC MYA-4762 TaxID=1051890 RepID=A0A3N4M1C3_9PEZI|nr:hypothetical protein L211DRAFT_563571 [Terfezia boudieri ATCC MYA-4762]